MSDFAPLLQFIRQAHNAPKDFVPLHAPVFSGNERDYVLDTIDSTFVSSVGAYVTQFEEQLKELTGAAYAIATVNGTAALHAALHLAGVTPDDLVLTQTLSFAATANAIAYCGADPVFLDVDEDTLGLSPDAVRRFLEASCELRDGICHESISERRITACVPMHTFGLPCRLDELVAICDEWHIPLVEDAAESLGSLYKDRHTGTSGLLGILSFNGNKIVTTGGGGAILTNNPELGARAKHITTTAKKPHRWEYEHDELGFNYRMPNLNAALGCAQLERLSEYVRDKRELAKLYRDFISETPYTFISEPKGTQSNYWLNAILLRDAKERDAFLTESNDAGIMTRPVWGLLHRLPMYNHCMHDDLKIASDLEKRLVNIPSSVRIGGQHD